jgi:hypothetical protein
MARGNASVRVFGVLTALYFKPAPVQFDQGVLSTAKRAFRAVCIDMLRYAQHINSALGKASQCDAS